MNHYYVVIGICIFSFDAIAAIRGRDRENLEAALIIPTITITAFGLLAGNTPLGEIKNLVNDLDEEMAPNTDFGRAIRNRNIAR